MTPFELMAGFLVVGAAVLGIEGFYNTVMRINYGFQKESYVRSVRALLGKTDVKSCFSRVETVYGEKVSVEVDFNDWPHVPLSFSTFLALWEAERNKFTICLLNQDDELPGAVLYDQNRDGKANARIVMSSRKDAKAFIKWFKNIRQEEESEELNRKISADYERIVSATEVMQQDLKKLHEKNHSAILQRAEENKAWRKNAEKRQEKIRNLRVKGSASDG